MGKEPDTLEYEFEQVSTETCGYSLFGGVGIETEGHREIILRRAAEGWRYAEWIPVKQRATGHVEEMDLVFARERADA